MKNLLYFIFIVILWFPAFGNEDDLSLPPLKKQAEWAKGLVWYQIFPERFRNGDTGNDPTVSEVPEAEGHPDLQVHPWTSDWYAMQPCERHRRIHFTLFRSYSHGDTEGILSE